MAVVKIPKVGKVGAIRSVPSAPSPERKYPGIQLEPAEDPVAEYVEGTDPTQTLPERCVEAWLLDQEYRYQKQRKIAGVIWTNYGSVLADFLVFDIPGRPFTVLRVQGTYWHQSPGRQYKDDEQARRLRGRGYHVVDLWDEDILRAVRRDYMDRFMTESIYNPNTT